MERSASLDRAQKLFDVLIAGFEANIRYSTTGDIRYALSAYREVEESWRQPDGSGDDAEDSESED